VNVTISMDEELVRKARHMAVDRGMSLSRFIAEVVKERVASDPVREERRAHLKKLLDEGLDLGTNGQITWTRDELHER
jgi:predicted metal-dependent peptidase